MKYLILFLALSVGAFAQSFDREVEARLSDNEQLSLRKINKQINPIASAAADKDAPASNTAAVVTYAASAGNAHVITGVAWSYNGEPTGGNLKIEDGSGTVVFSMDITTSGAGVIEFPILKKGTVNTALIVTLAAGGSGVSGKVNVLNHVVFKQ